MLVGKIKNFWFEKIGSLPAHKSFLSDSMPTLLSYLQKREISMSKARRVSAVTGLLFLVISLSAEPQQLLPSVTCPDLSEMGTATNRVSVYIAEALHPSGLVCVHIRNGGNRAIQISPEGVHLEMREKRGNTQQFRDYETILQEQLKLSGGETPRIEREGTFAVGQGDMIATQGMLNVVLPSNALPVSTGMYRVCLSYTPLGGKNSVRLCSPVASISSSLSGCPPLPVEPSAGRVSLHVAKAVDISGVVCIRAVNGLTSPITFSGRSAFWLQRWNKDHWEKRDYVSESVLTLPSGETIPVMSASPAYELSKGESIDQHLPGLGAPTPSGKYRACFTFWHPQKDKQTVCSDAFPLP
jgi:hypothetical protein